MSDLIYAHESYQIVGACMQVHNFLGPGFLEAVYKDALEIEFKRMGIPYVREKAFEVNYKGVILPHHYYCDFEVFDKIILEVKCKSKLPELETAQCINYLKVSGNKLALLVNFGVTSLKPQRIVY